MEERWAREITGNEEIEEWWVTFKNVVLEFTGKVWSYRRVCAGKNSMQRIQSIENGRLCKLHSEGKGGSCWGVICREAPAD